MTTPAEAPREALPEPLKVVAWRYKTPHTTHLCHSQLDHYFSVAEGATYIKGEALVRLTDAQSALESERQAHAAEVERLRGDAARMDWLMEHTVNVRVHMRYGSRNLFWAGPQEGDGEILPSDLRTRIDQAIARGKT